MYNSNTYSLGLILGVEVFYLLVTVQEHCELYLLVTRAANEHSRIPGDQLHPHSATMSSNLKLGSNWKSCGIGIDMRRWAHGNARVRILLSHC